MPTSQRGDERRAFPRIPLLTEVAISDVAADGDKVAGGTMRDLSLGGMRVEMGAGARDRFEKGGVWTVSMRLPGEAEPVRLRGEVAWKRGEEVGFSFSGDDEAAQNRIAVAIERELEALESFKDEKTPQNTDD